MSKWWVLKSLSIFVKFKMVRHYIRKTERCMYPDGYILKAVKILLLRNKKYVMFPMQPPSQKDLYWDMLKIAWLLEFKMKLKQLQALGVTKTS